MFEKATKKQSKLRLAVFGPSGSGKTYTALRIAKGMSDKIALIDTERRSASKYADKFGFDVANIEKATINNYVQTISEAAGVGYEVLIIDSLSHGWHELLQEVEKIAKAKYRGNTWSAWSEGTPLQRQLVNAILDFPGHVIATMRTKTEWTIETDDKGRNKPVRIGLSPEQGKGIEYEFDMLIEMTPEHFANIIKDRTGKYQDVTIDKPGEDFGKELMDWLNSGNVDETEKKQDELLVAINATKTVDELQTIWLDNQPLLNNAKFKKIVGNRKKELLIAASVEPQNVES